MDCLDRVELVPQPGFVRKQARCSESEAGRVKLLVSDFEYLTFVAFAASLEKAGSFDDLLAGHVSEELGTFVNRGICPQCHK
jgi:hypothetical protein